jgi:hypothetical protein
MKNRAILAASAVLAFLSMSLSVGAADKFKLPGFDGTFRLTTERNQPGGATMTPDPLDEENTSDVFKFSISPGECVKEECEQQSVRATAEQRGEPKQPATAWYGWDMYFVPDFPFGAAQVRGHQVFTEFKDQRQCQLVALINNPHSDDQFLSWSMEKPTGEDAEQYGGDCMVVFEKPIAPMIDLVGAWHRFELFVRWTKDGDGRFQMFLDGEQVLDYEGPTCFRCNKFNYFLFGNYLCCTSGTQNVVPATVYYRYISRAATREELVWQ